MYPASQSCAAIAIASQESLLRVNCLRSQLRLVQQVRGSNRMPIQKGAALASQHFYGVSMRPNDSVVTPGHNMSTPAATPRVSWLLQPVIPIHRTSCEPVPSKPNACRHVRELPHTWNGIVNVSCHSDPPANVASCE